jgi:hypothetical protein
MGLAPPDPAPLSSFTGDIERDGDLEGDGERAWPARCCRRGDGDAGSSPLGSLTALVDGTHASASSASRSALLVAV